MLEYQHLMEGWLSGLKRRIANPLGVKSYAGSNPVPSANFVLEPWVISHKIERSP